MNDTRQQPESWPREAEAGHCQAFERFRIATVVIWVTVRVGDGCVLRDREDVGDRHNVCHRVDNQVGDRVIVGACGFGLTNSLWLR